MSEKKESPIYVKNGWLYRDNVRLQLEFGNLEQIAAIRKYEKYMQQLKDGIEPECVYEVIGNAEFKCICGLHLQVNDIDANYEGDVSCFDGLKKKCNNCGKIYRFVVESKYKIIAPGRKYLESERLVVRFKDHE